MATPTFVAKGTTVKVASGNMASVGLPAGHTTNDILVLYISQDDNVVSSVDQSYTKWIGVNTGTTCRGEVWWKRDGGSEVAPTVTRAAGDSGIAYILAYRGCITTGDPSDVTPVTNTDGGVGSTSMTALAATTVTAQCLISLSYHQDDNTTTASYADASLANLAEVADDNTTLGLDSAIAVANGDLATPGSTGNCTATRSTTGAWVAVTIPLRPPAAGVTLDGTGANAVAGSGDLLLAADLAGTGANSAASSSQLLATMDLQGHGDAASASTSDLVITLSFAGTGANATTGVGELLATLDLAGHGDTATVGVADLQTLLDLAGHGDIAVTGGADLLAALDFTGYGANAAVGVAGIVVTTSTVVVTVTLFDYRLGKRRYVNRTPGIRILDQDIL